MRAGLLTVVLAAAIGAAPGRANILSESFDTDTSANWNILTSSADTSVAFGFDYSTVGVPASPNGGGSTLGLRLAANIDAPGTVEAITLTPKGYSFSGTYQMTFDMWINANGPFPAGGTGSTEFLTAGIGHDNATVNLGTTGSGGWFAVSGEGGSSRDYRAYKNAGEQFAESGQFFAGTSSASGGAHNNSDPYYAAFGGIDVGATLPAQAALHPNQTGVTAVGSPGFAWHAFKVTVSGTTARWEIDGLPIAQLDATIGNTFPLSGNISLGYMDIFTSVSDNPATSFGLIDNLFVIPEPSTLALGLLAAAGLWLRRRRA